MPFDRFLIAPINSGLQTDLRPWLIPDDAFSELENAYVFRGRVRKRFGGRFMGTGWPTAAVEPLYSRLRIALEGGSGVGTTDGAGDATGTVPGDIFKVGQMFSIGTEMYTVNVTGTPAVMLDTGSTTTATYDTTTGVYTFAGAPINTQIYFYPAEPVMGLTNYESGPINDQPSYAFDTQFAYVFSGGAWNRSGIGVTPIWHGDNSQFFWAANWDGITPNSVVLYVTNFNATIGAPAATDDPMWYFDGTTWAQFSPLTVFITATGNFVQTCRIIVQFKDRLLLLNTIEQDPGGPTNTQYVNRCRYSHNGSPLAANAWLEPNQATADGAGFIDATTEEAIVSAEFIKDRLIVYFERSTWELAYTGNQILPFVWQKINTELGSESTFSSVPFDKVILTIGNVGVHACNGANVERIDFKIPDQIFQILDKKTGVARVAGIRDYYVEMVYWSFPSTYQNANEIFPTKVLVYNYRNGSWAFNDDCITAFGYFEQQMGTTWASTTDIWEEANMSWTSGTVATQFRQVIAGNQEGFVFIVDADFGRNARALQITDMANSSSGVILTIIDHTLTAGDYIMVEGAQGINPIFNGSIYNVAQFIDKDHIRLASPSLFLGVYTGGGYATRISNIEIKTKQWNPYDSKGQNVYISKIDFAVLRTTNGEITVDYAPSAADISSLFDGANTGALQGDGTLDTFPYDPDIYPLEQFQERLWHSIYFQTEGTCIQLTIFLSDFQIKIPQIAFSDFQLEGMVLHTMPISTRLQ
jgi:hypothetical protein